ncbi:MAG: RsmE family RNA methyltransferase [Bryobacteraceae bacterium]
MARRRFFVPEIRRGAAELTGADAEHLVRVLRAEVGQVYEICDNRDVYLAEIETARKSLVVFRCQEKLAAPEAEAAFVLVPALFKFDRFEWLIEKATELGVARIRPFEAVRTERGLAEAAQKRSARWERIAVEASQQSRRNRLPVIEAVAALTEALAVDANVKLLLDEDAGTMPIIQCVPERRSPSDTIALLLGPEGGWVPEERAKAVAADWAPVSLGKTVLRAETAGVAGLAVVNALWGGSGFMR